MMNLDDRRLGSFHEMYYASHCNNASADENAPKNANDNVGMACGDQSRQALLLL